MKYHNKEKNKQTGELGESIACKYLRDRGFEVLQRNYWRKWGEIDIVARRTGVVHFVEVKTVTHETKQQLEEAVARGTWRPEELVHQFKLNQINKALETWISDHRYSGEWQIDVVTVRTVPRETYAVVNFIENVSN